MVPGPPRLGSHLGHYYPATFTDPDYFQLHRVVHSSPQGLCTYHFLWPGHSSWLSPKLDSSNPSGVPWKSSPRGAFSVYSRKGAFPFISATARSNCFLHSAVLQPVTTYCSCLFPISPLLYKLLGGGDHTWTVTIITLSPQFLEECLANGGE